MGGKQMALTLVVLSAVLLVGGVAQAGDPDLMAWWKLDDGVGTVVLDSSGYENHGTVMNPAGGLGTGNSVWFDDPDRGTVISFNGTDGSGAYVDTGVTIPAMTLDNSFTWAFWAKQPASQATNNDTMLGNRYGGAAGPQFIKFTPTRFECYNNDTTYVNGINYTSIPADVWIHHAVVKDGAELTYYRDGVVTLTNTMTLTVDANPFYMGADGFAGAQENWQGYLSDVRLYTRALSEGEVRDAMAGKGPISETAADPVPESGAVDVPRDVVLSWTPGEYAATHDVYFGTSPDDVNNADRTNPLGVLVSQGQTTASYGPEGLLELDQTYYWRVDEANAAPDNTIFKGELWSFTVEPFAYAIDNVMATSNMASAVGQGPENTVNGSGLNADDQHSTATNTMWVGAVNPNEPSYIQFEFDRAYKLYEMLIWNYNLDFEMWLGFGIKDVTVEYSLDGADWTVLGDIVVNQAPGLKTYTYNTVVPFEGVAAQYVRLTIGSSYVSADSRGLSEVRFMHIPVFAREPQPSDGATDVALDTPLSWRSGREVASHEVYVGIDANALVLADTSSQASYNATLDLDMTYYWQVVEVNDAEIISSWASDLWSFTTQEYIEIEGFESYNDDIDAETTIWQTWVDGLEDGANGGSMVGNDPSPFSELTIVHSGRQSMPMFYENTTASAFSEADRALSPGQNWTASGIKTLSLWFYGAQGNGGQLYVKINNTKVLYDGQASDIATEIWQPWNIDLTAVGGNLTNVTTVSIGVEGTGAGVLYIDDVRLYAKTPELIVPSEPDAANLVGSWSFDGNVNDDSGRGHNGTLVGTGITFENDPVRGQVLSLPGGDDIYVSIGAVGISGTMARTIACWAKADNTTIPDWTLIFGFTGKTVEDGTGGNGSHFNIGSLGGPGGVGAHCWGWEETIFSDTEALEWHHYAMSYDGTTIRYYGDGRPMDTDPAKSNVQDLSLSGDRVHVGSRITQASSFPGNVDDAVIYNVQLTDGQVAWLAGRTAPLYKPF